MRLDKQMQGPRVREREREREREKEEGRGGSPLYA
jgi:hypothetical protein